MLTIIHPVVEDAGPYTLIASTKYMSANTTIILQVNGNAFFLLSIILVQLNSF